MRVLLVEDEARIADFVARGLSEQGYAVDDAADGDEALQWADIADKDIKVDANSGTVLAVDADD